MNKMGDKKLKMLFLSNNYIWSFNIGQKKIFFLCQLNEFVILENWHLKYKKYIYIIKVPKHKSNINLNDSFVVGDFQ